MASPDVFRPAPQDAQQVRANPAPDHIGKSYFGENVKNTAEKIIVFGLSLSAFSAKQKGKEKPQVGGPATNPTQVERTQKGVTEEPEPGSKAERRRHERHVHSIVTGMIGKDEITYESAKRINDKKRNE